MITKSIGDNCFLPDRRNWLKFSLYLAIATLVTYVLKSTELMIGLGSLTIVTFTFGGLDYISTTRNALRLNDEGIHYETISKEFSSNWNNVNNINIYPGRFLELYVTTNDNRYCYIRIGYYHKKTLIAIAEMIQEKMKTGAGDDINTLAQGRMPFGFQLAL